MTSGELTTQQGPWQAMILHPVDVSCPVYHHLDAGDLYLFKDFNVGNKVIPAYVRGATEAAQVDRFEES